MATDVTKLITAMVTVQMTTTMHMMTIITVARVGCVMNMRGPMVMTTVATLMIVVMMG